ncbi:VOC family protein [Kutzneria sp. CA-103260]|uniref:VOC family protein n=1 Tax=Kutzneria sp. CA-103260 TaxID=2802641 RepID=UPI001BA736B5|nr:VOC family protein [Kutzneria sp. CA-103260]QUQ68660.1 glyoxalase [Kutzneria sp. CA-103260]
MGTIVYAITFDCANAAELAEFWARATDRAVDPDASEVFASIDGKDDRPRMMFIKVSEGKTAKNRVHLDLVSTDLDAEAARLVSLGAARGGEFTEAGAHWITLADPEGNEFDLIGA